MKKFKFRLQTILDLKKREEDLIQKDLIRLKKEKSKVVDQLNQFKEEKRKLQQKIEEDEGKRIDLKLALRSREYIEYLNGEIEELTMQLDYWKKEISKCKERLLEKTKEKKSFLKLKEKKNEQYWKEYRAKEQKLNDELANNKYIRKNISSNL
ncbi:flagellar export protein FliJ [Halonatronum saccharophilum]|uniref:flagellar export protein FliJ n=1 Tax=Halonatronum saccharophilum TaxID=150060 RepID=UPI00048868BC|nr:flagellar export protein FliJ [Halonatronum saccharophilum]